MQLEHLCAIVECWVSANCYNEAISLQGWAVLNKQEQQGRVHHWAICGSTLAKSAAVFTAPVAVGRTEMAATQCRNFLSSTNTANDLQRVGWKLKSCVSHKLLAWSQGEHIFCFKLSTYFNVKPQNILWSSTRYKVKLKSLLLITLGSIQEAENGPAPISACFRDSEDK